MSRIIKGLLAGLITGVIGVLLFMTYFGFSLEENLGLNLLFKIRGRRTPPSEVVLVIIDSLSARKLNQPREPYQWSRSLHAELLDNLVKRGAAVIAFDIVFDKERSLNDDRMFAESIGKAGNVILSEYIETEKTPLRNSQGVLIGYIDTEKRICPIPMLAQSALASAPFPLPKIPIKVNRFWTFRENLEYTPTLPTIVLQTVALQFYEEFITLLKEVKSSSPKTSWPGKDSLSCPKGFETTVKRLKQILSQESCISEEMLSKLGCSPPLPLVNLKQITSLKQKIIAALIKMYSGDNIRYLNFYGPPGTFTTVPYYKVLEQVEGDNDPISIDFKGKIVFIGLSELFTPGQKDNFYMVYSQKNGIDISGVEIAATAFANLLEDTCIKLPSLPQIMTIIILWGILLGFLCFFLQPLLGLLSISFFGILYLGFALFCFRINCIWYPLVIPFLIQAPLCFSGTIIYRYCETNRERKNIKQAFKYYLPEKFIDELAKNILDINKTSQIVYGTCLITDIEQFTAFSEIMDPEELSHCMKNYFESIFKPVNHNEGIISHVLGDSILAIWATGKPDKTLRYKACIAALEIAHMNYQYYHPTNPLYLPTRIGLHSGYFSLSHIGSIPHIEYAPVGDIVNTASRIEGLNKYLGTKMLVSEEVISQLNTFLARKVGRFVFFGKTKAIVIYEIISKIENSTQEGLELCKIFQEGLRLFTLKSWEEAIQIFNESLRIKKGDGPSLYYIEKCKEYLAYPPEGEWDGRIYLERK